MKIIEIQAGEEGQRLDRFLSKHLPHAGKSLLQKSIRKKNITLNDQKARAQSILTIGDKIQIYFSDETFEKFSKAIIKEKALPPEFASLFQPPLYEDAQLLAIDKPVGLLSQGDGSGQPDLASLATLYLPQERAFTAGVSNRLDRNTSGVVLIPKNTAFKRRVDRALRDRKGLKEYRTIVKGPIKNPQRLCHYLLKNEENNKVSVHNEAIEGTLYAELEIIPLKIGSSTTYVSVFLKTGRSHQIRAQLSAIGHGIIGDQKYGMEVEDPLPSLKHQILHSYRYRLDDLGIDIVAPLPAYFLDLLSALDLKR